VAGYFVFTKMKRQYYTMTAAVKTQLVENENQVAGMQQSITALQQEMQQTQTLITQQAQKMASLQIAQQGNVDQWRVAEAKYLVAMANHHLQLAHDVSTGIVLLQQADKALQNIQDANLLPLRKAIALDIARLQAVAPFDMTGMYLRLSALNSQLDALPLLSDSLKGAQSSANILTPVAQADHLPWWKVAFFQTIQGLSKIVIVRKIDAKAVPFALPEEKLFLYQNLHAQIENAQWGLLHRNAIIYQDSLARADAWIRQYFALNVPSTQAALHNIAELQKINIGPQAIDLANTSQLFDDYFGNPR
jgi:uroporphyrin-3 C-methyltransferase